MGILSYIADIFIIFLPFIIDTLSEFEIDVDVDINFSEMYINYAIFALKMAIYGILLLRLLYLFFIKRETKTCDNIYIKFATTILSIIIVTVMFILRYRKYRTGQENQDTINISI